MSARIACRALLAGVVTLVSTTSSSVASAQSVELIRIGFHVPLTGFAAGDGKFAQLGAELALEQINAAGGVLRRQLELVVHDDQAAAEQAVPLAKKLLGEDVKAVISGSYSGPTRAAAGVFQNAGISYVSAYAIHPDITRTGNYVFRISFMGEVQGRAGAITALLGSNGAGKTSTVMAVAGHVEAKAGSIRLDGEDITNTPPPERTRRGIGLVPEDWRIFGDLTVAESRLVGGYSRPQAAAAQAEDRVRALFPRCRERFGQRADTLSGGEQQMLAMGRALMVNPRVMLVDELSLGPMPAAVDLCFDALGQLKRQGVACLVVEQNTHKALARADEVVVVAAGLLVYQAPVAEARQSTTLVDTFLGIEVLDV
jgi:branched-chain amino acid transport system ATP-binding protein